MTTQPVDQEINTYQKKTRNLGQHKAAQCRKSDWRDLKFPTILNPSTDLASILSR